MQQQSLHQNDVEHEQQENELIKLAKIFWHRRYLITVFFLAFLVVTVFQLNRAEKIYVSTCEIHYNPETNRIVEFGEIGRTASGLNEILTQIEIIRSQEVTRSVIESLGRQANKPSGEESTLEEETSSVWTPIEAILGGIRNARNSLREWILPTSNLDLPRELIEEQNQIRRMQRRITIKPKTNTQIIQITAKHPQPEMAAAIANEYAIQYSNYLLNNRKRSYQTAQEFYNTELKDAQLRLEQAENKLYEYSAEADLKLLAKESELAVTQIQELSREIFELEKQLQLKIAVDEKSELDEIQLRLLSENQTYTTIYNRLQDLRLNRIKLESENLQSRELSILNEEIQALEKRLIEEETELKELRKGELLWTQTNLDVLLEKKNDQENLLTTLNQRMIQLNVLQREVDAQQTLYEVLLRELNETNVAANVKPFNVNITEEAIPARAADEPRVGMSLAFNGILGLMLGCFLSLGLHYIDRSIRDPREVERATLLPTLGSVPYMGGLLGRKGTVQTKGKRAPVRLLDSFDNYSKEVESFRLIRTSLQYSSAEKPPKMIIITSVNPSEGKSTTCANLALSYATLNKKTLIIDADLKLPSMHNIFVKNRQPGLTDVLVGEKKLADAIQETPYTNLDLLTAGHATVNPAEMLESKAMDDLLSLIRTKYDQVLIDTTPISGLADPLALASRTDGICLVGSVGRTQLDDFKRTVERIRQLNLKMLGVVYNHKQRGSKSPFSYGNYGKYGKYGSYGNYGYFRKEAADANANSEANANDEKFDNNS
ncbi:MAG: GumC family protein [Sumerlaeia bacterium]